MSELKMIACDTCGAAAPPRYSQMNPIGGWMVLQLDREWRELMGSGTWVDLCSPICLEAYAARMVDAANLTTVGRATARPAAPKPLRRPRPKELPAPQIIDVASSEPDSGAAA